MRAVIDRSVLMTELLPELPLSEGTRHAITSAVPDEGDAVTLEGSVLSTHALDEWEALTDALRERADELTEFTVPGRIFTYSVVTDGRLDVVVAARMVREWAQESPHHTVASLRIIRLLELTRAVSQP